MNWSRGSLFVRSTRGRSFWDFSRFFNVRFGPSIVTTGRADADFEALATLPSLTDDGIVFLGQWNEDFLDHGLKVGLRLANRRWPWHYQTTCLFFWQIYGR